MMAENAGRRLAAAGMIAALCATPSAAMMLPETSEEFDRLEAALKVPVDPTDQGVASKTIARAQIRMDRGGISPGVIDGRDSPRFRQALSLWNQHRPDQHIDLDTDNAADDAYFLSYEITKADTAGPFAPQIPVLYIRQAELTALHYRNAREMLAERFHIDEDYLARLNPNADFNRPGTVITVPDTGRYLQTRVHRIEADKARRLVLAYDDEDGLIAAYPASIGSKATPSPAGSHTVRNKAENPHYTYDPDGSAQPGLSDGLVRLPPGPNGPVGNAWIGLSKRSYGIHGTPEPSKIGLTASYGCIRLTNWDALELARLVRRGTEVTFTGP